MKMTRNRMNEKLVQALESFFQHTPSPTNQQLATLSRQYNYNKTNIYKWFWNKRRAKGTICKGYLRHRRRAHSLSQSSSEMDEELDSDVPTKQVSAGSLSSSVSMQQASAGSLNSNVSIHQASVGSLNADISMQQASAGSLNSNVSMHQATAESLNMVMEDSSSLIIPANNLFLKNQMISQNSSGVYVPSQYQRVSSSEGQSTSSSHFKVDDILNPLSFREVSVLEKIYDVLPNPTSEDIAKLASHFVKIQEKEEQVQAWFVNRHEQSSNLTQDLQFEISED